MGRKLKHAVSLKWLAEAIGCEYAGIDISVDRVDSVRDAGSASLCFVKNAIWASRVREGAVVIGGKSDLIGLSGGVIYSNSPRLDFARLLSILDTQVGFVWSQEPAEVHPTAIIGVNSVLGKGVKVGANSVIGNNVVIGDEVIIGERCYVKSCTVIGEEGFGFERDSDGAAVRLPHIGTVIIGNNVEVGSLTTVCRGTLDDTELLDGAKIDDHVHIAHNIRVGEHAFVIACAEISGGVKIGKRAWIAPGASILNQLTIGDDAVVGLGAVVVRDVENGQTVVGNPAKPLSPR